MPLVPENITPRISWYQVHIAKWFENASGLDLDAEQLNLLQQALDAARDAQRAQYAAHAAARTATQRLAAAMETLSQRGAKTILHIKARAAQEGQDVYALASIPAPAEPAPISPPGEPYRFHAKLLGSGWIELAWKCQNPRGSSGTMYEIARQIPGERDGEFVHLATVGKKKFLDDTLPPGTPKAVYRVTAIRSTRRGIANFFTLHFGSTGRFVSFAEAVIAA